MRTYSKVGGKLQRWDVGTNDPAEAVAEVANVTRATAMAVVDPLEPLFVPDYSPRFGVKAAARAIAP